MPVKKTFQIGEPVLRETAKNVDIVDNLDVKSLITDLIDTMRKADLVGIAAPQLGVAWRIFVSEIRETETRKDGFDPLTVYINPVITSVSREKEVGYEGCGSVINGELFAEVERFSEITVNYSDQNGQKLTKTASGLLGRVIQHENDHLNGVLFTDLADSRSFVSRDYYLSNIKGK